MLRTFLMILVLIFTLAGCGKEENTENTNNGTQIQRTATEENRTIENKVETVVEKPKEVKEEKPKEEIEIGKFTTKIYTKDSERQNNLQITCSTLNGTTVEPGKTFSFTGTVGKATSAKGYQEADIFDSNGNKKKGLGGGNCQVSSTLYNAVLETPNLEVVERHEHSNKVPYVKQGKDAAVAYGSVDFKFKNNNDYTIKITAEATKNNVTITIFKMV